MPDRQGAAMEDTRLAGIPEEAASVVRDLATTLQSSLGRDLVSLNIVGSCLTGDFISGVSDVNTVIVVDKITPGILDAIASSTKGFQKRRLAVPLVMDRNHIARSLDAFPLEFLDMKLFHRVVLGEDVFRQIEIDPSFLRLQCERELTARLIKLGRGYIASRGEARSVSNIVKEALPGYFPILRAILFLLRPHAVPPAPRQDVLKAAQEALNIPLECLRQAQELRTARSFLGDTRARDIFHDLYRTTHDLSRAMDTLDVR